MKTTITIFALTVSFSVFSQGIQFIEARTDSDIAIINKKADKEKKLIFIDCYTEWCGPCKWMEKNVFTNDTVAKFYNEHFVCVRMDMEKGIGISRMYKYQVKAFPTLVFIDFNGIVHRSTGARDVKGLIELGETALNPEKRLSHWQEKYKSGDRQPEFIRGYLLQLRAAGMETKEVSDWYFYTLKEGGLLTEENLEIMLYFLNSTDNRIFRYFFHNRENYSKLNGRAKEISRKIYNLYYNDCNTALEKKDSVRYHALTEEISKSGWERADELLAFVNTQYCVRYDKGKADQAFIDYVNKYPMTVSDTSADSRIRQWNDLNSYAWMFYEDSLITNKASLEQALAWAKKGFELSNEYAVADTYTALLYKLGKKKEALNAAEKAIELGKKTGEDTSSTEELLEKIKKMK